MKEEFTKDSVDKIYEFARDGGYKEGYADGYRQCAKDIIKKLQKVFGGGE